MAAQEREIEIWIGGKAFPAALNESITARQILGALPLSGDGSRWGDEIYFDIGIELDPTNPQEEEVEIGDIAYWRPGIGVLERLCVFSLGALQPVRPIAHERRHLSPLLESSSDILRP